MGRLQLNGNTEHTTRWQHISDYSCTLATRSVTTDCPIPNIGTPFRCCWFPQTSSASCIPNHLRAIWRLPGARHGEVKKKKDVCMYATNDTMLFYVASMRSTNGVHCIVRNISNFRSVHLCCKRNTYRHNKRKEKANMGANQFTRNVEPTYKNRIKAERCSSWQVHQSDYTLK
jgi:hypothetical protein